MQDRLYQRKDKKTGQPKGPFYGWYYDRDSIRVRVSTRCLDRRAAANRLRELEREAHDPNRPAEDAPAHSVAEALHYFVNGGYNPKIAVATLGMYLEKAGHVQRLLGNDQVNALDPSRIKWYITQRLDDGAEESTVQKELVTLRQALWAARERKLLLCDPRSVFPRFRASSKPKERWLTPGEALQLLGQLRRPERRLWVIVALYTGGRDSEVDGLRWEHIDWQKRQVTIKGTKTDKSDRVIPLQRVLGAVLEPLKQPSGYVVGEWSNVRGRLHAACKSAKIDPCSPNDLRRTFASWLINQGVPANVVAKLLGHGSSKMVERVYGRIEQALLQREMRKLSGGCDAGETDSGPSESLVALVTPESLRKLAEVLTGMVPRGRIELPTRGFSVRTPIKRYADLRRKTSGETPVRQVKAFGGRG